MNVFCLVFSSSHSCKKVIGQLDTCLIRKGETCIFQIRRIQTGFWQTEGKVSKAAATLQQLLMSFSVSCPAHHCEQHWRHGRWKLASTVAPCRTWEGSPLLWQVSWFYDDTLTKPSDQKQLGGRKGLWQLTGYHPSLREDRNSRKNLNQKLPRTTACCLTGSRLFSFLTQPRSLSQEWCCL